ncbi:hypothetical protein T4C_4093 [Trichinella pseudospiralis]|uniref:Uncharacterized protein n=1 Tax=Trichinella pseudospiralis TaxID=6337 RepID=A0A0V1GRX6_TRIPS|nr:hypothetical protein T4C_4093 [Trichinella pseudospiralis]
MQIILLPEAEPGASPRAGDFSKFQNFKNFLKFSLRQRPRRYAPGHASGILQNFRIFQNFSPRRRPRLLLRANKNLHIPSGYANGILLHNICPQAIIFENPQPEG